MFVMHMLKFHFYFSTCLLGTKQPTCLSPYAGFDVDRVEVSLRLYCSDSSFNFCSALGKTSRK